MQREKLMHFTFFALHPNVISVPDIYSFKNKYIYKYFIFNCKLEYVRVEVKID